MIIFLLSFLTICTTQFSIDIKRVTVRIGTKINSKCNLRVLDYESISL